MDAVTQAALAQAAQHCQASGWKGLAGCCLSNNSIPTVEQVRTAATKAVAESPPWIHWSKTDMAPQLKCVDAPLNGSTTAITSRLTIAAATMRGYRMARASHAATAGGAYYYECKLLPGPTAREIAQALPPNARLGPSLQRSLQNALLWEEKQEKKLKDTARNNEEEDSPENRGKKRKQIDDETSPPKVGGNVRLGWSMRTGDLQAPCGFDRWSYGIRDSTGSIIHKSNRQDTWGGEPLEAGDVVGCAILLDANDSGQNHIRFFKNGRCMGQFIMSKGKRVGGEAFSGIDSGTYYPAVSSYMGGSVRANFGPYFVCPPRKVPAGLKLRPLSDLCAPPLSPEDAVTKISATAKLFRKPEHAQALKDAVHAEAEVLCQAHEMFSQSQLEYVRQERLEHGSAVQDLPDLPIKPPTG